MGIVDKVGPNVKNVSVGQRVVASFQIACGDCTYCRQKLSSFCENTNPSTSVTLFACTISANPFTRLQNYMYGHRDAGFFGYSHFTGGFPGGQAEYVRVPKGNVNLLSIPDGIADEKVLYLSDVLCTSYHCVMDTGVKQGDVVGIWVSLHVFSILFLGTLIFIPDVQGLGPIGQCVARFAKLKGASRVIGIDRVPERLEFARTKSGIEMLDFSQHTDVVKRLQEVVPGGLDVALDCGNRYLPLRTATP